MAPKRKVFAGLAAALLLAAPLQALRAATPDWIEVEDEDHLVPQLGLTVWQVKGATLYTDRGAPIGEVEEVLMTPAGYIAGLAVELDGFPEREVILRFDQVRRLGDNLVTLLTEAQLRAQPEWDD